MHIYIGPTKISTRTSLNFLGIYICVFYRVPWVYIQIKHKMAYCYFLSAFNWISGKNLIFRYHFLSPLSSLYMLTILWLNDCTSREEPCFSPLLCSCCYKDVRCKLQVTTSSMCLLNPCACCFLNPLQTKIAYSFVFWLQCVVSDHKFQHLLSFCVSSFILISGCDSFSIEPKKKKAFSIQEQTVILAQVDANRKTCIAMATHKELYCQHWTLPTKVGKIQKAVTNNMAGSRVKGKASNSLHLKNWKLCWPNGLNKLQTAMQ